MPPHCQCSRITHMASAITGHQHLTQHVSAAARRWTGAYPVLTSSLLVVFSWVDSCRICFISLDHVSVSKIASVRCGAGGAAGRSVVAALSGGGGGGGPVRRAPRLPAGGPLLWRSSPS